MYKIYTKYQAAAGLGPAHPPKPGPEAPGPALGPAPRGRAGRFVLFVCVCLLYWLVCWFLRLLALLVWFVCVCLFVLSCLLCVWQSLCLGVFQLDQATLFCIGLCRSVSRLNSFIFKQAHTKCWPGVMIPFTSMRLYSMS